MRKIDDGLFIIVIFVDDIIFGGNDEESGKFSEEIKNEFVMSMMGEMKFFLDYRLGKAEMGYLSHKSSI